MQCPFNLAEFQIAMRIRPDFTSHILLITYIDAHHTPPHQSHTSSITDCYHLRHGTVFPCDEILDKSTDGLQFLSAYMPIFPLRLSSLLHLLTSRLRHESTGTPVVQILSRLLGCRLKSVGDQAGLGSTMSFIGFRLAKKTLSG